MSRPLIIYHSPCSDGWCAAWIMHRCLGNDPELFPAKYGDDPPKVDGRDVYVVDFSYPRDVMQRMYQDANLLWVFDHHKTAEAECSDLPFTIFDQKQSGAGLAYWWCKTEGMIDRLADDPAMRQIVKGMEGLSRYVEDRDLFKFALQGSEPINSALRSYDWDLATWDMLAKRMAVSPDGFLVEGEAIQRYRKQLIKSHVSHAHEIEIDGQAIKATLCSAGEIVSEVAGELAEGEQFAATYCPTTDGQLLVSLRSPSRGADVSEIAVKYGGGGHKHAAGFRAEFAEIKGVDIKHGAMISKRVMTQAERDVVAKT